jgi:hypothetical protein
MPTSDDYPWLRDERIVHTALDPKDPKAAAMLHGAKQARAIDDARQATSVAPPGPATPRNPP